jgi:hypothetical protein
MLWKDLWRDESGIVNSMDLILISTILVLGMIVGLVSLRNQVVQELSDTANAVGSLNQSYSYTSRTITSGSFSAFIAGASYSDQPNVSADIDLTAWPPTPKNTNPGED